MKSKLFLVVLISLNTFIYGQSDWKTKDFDKWNAKDVDTILNASDWIRKQEVRLQYETKESVAAGSFITGVSSVGGVSQGVQRDQKNTVKQGSIQPAIDFTFTLRLRSSMAIRLALIRKNQFETDTKSLKKEELDLFNKKQRGLFDCPACVENYVVTLTSSSKENKNYDAVHATFAKAQLADLKRYIYLLNEKGEKRELVHFVAPKVPGEEAIFFFKRFNDKGVPLFSPLNKQIILNLTQNEVNQVTNFKIEIAPLIVGDKVDF